MKSCDFDGRVTVRWAVKWSFLYCICHDLYGDRHFSDYPWQYMSYKLPIWWQHQAGHARWSHVTFMGMSQSGEPLTGVLFIVYGQCSDLYVDRHFSEYSWQCMCYKLPIRWQNRPVMLDEVMCFVGRVPVRWAVNWSFLYSMCSDLYGDRHFSDYLRQYMSFKLPIRWQHQASHARWSHVTLLGVSQSGELLTDLMPEYFLLN